MKWIAAVILVLVAIVQLNVYMNGVEEERLIEYCAGYSDDNLMKYALCIGYGYEYWKIKGRVI